MSYEDYETRTDELKKIGEPFVFQRAKLIIKYIEDEYMGEVKKRYNVVKKLPYTIQGDNQNLFSILKAYKGKL